MAVMREQRPGSDPIDEASFRPPLVDHLTGPGKREVDLYVRTYTTLLQSSGAIGVSSLEPAHLTAAPSLHAGAAEPAPDMNAFAYSSQRLPVCILDVRHIVLGQSAQAFARAGLDNLSDWTTQSAPGRRRKWLYDGKDTLAAYIASASDLNDLIPTIVALQIEWNKIHRLIVGDSALAETLHAAATAATPDRLPRQDRLVWIGERLRLSPPDWTRLRAIWGGAVWKNLAKLATERKRYTLRMLGGSYLGYNRSTRHWWASVAHLQTALDLHDRPIYFISSNTHSIVNVLSGAVRRRKDTLATYIRRSGHAELVPELDALEAGRSRSSWDNLLYFAARHYFAEPGRESERRGRNDEERERGIHHVDGRGVVDVGIQVIDLAKLDPASFDPRL
jgi:hypothetical protein